MTLRLPLFALAAASLALDAGAAERMAVTATHALDIARPAETISVPWARVNASLPHAQPQHLIVRDAGGHLLPYQIINVAPEAKDPQYVGAAYSELLFQHDFAPGEKSADFTIETTEQTVAPFPPKTFGRYVPERLDDFAWENDKVAHRTYGPALAAPDAEHRSKEVLVTSGLDIWFKRVPYPIVDRWYNIGHDHYHRDEGEGIDMYNVGASRGAGGTGVWDGKRLWVGANYKTWKVLANGPVRTIFELSYDGWDAAGTRVTEIKRFTVDAGHYFDRIDSTFGFDGPRQLTSAIGLNRHPSDKGQEVKVDFVENAADKSLVQWVTQKSLGDFGVAVIAPGAASPAFAGDKDNALTLAPVTNGQPLRYYVGAAWTRAGEIKSQQDWQRYVADEAARLRAPVSVTVAAAQ
jgi:hypothetical protein